MTKNAREKARRTALQEVIIYLSFTASPLSLRKLVKLVYLADLYHYKRCGSTMSGVDFLHYHFGPWSPDIPRAFEELCDAGILRERKVVTKRGHVATVPAPTVGKTTISLPREMLETLGQVSREWGRRQPDDVVRFTKQTRPFVATRFGERIDFCRTARISDKRFAALWRYTLYDTLRTGSPMKGPHDPRVRGLEETLGDTAYIREPANLELLGTVEPNVEAGTG